MKAQRIVTVVLRKMPLFLITPIAYAQVDQPLSEPQGQMIDAFELARKHAASSSEVQQEMLVHRVYDLSECIPFYFWGENKEKLFKRGERVGAFSEITTFRNKALDALSGAGILRDEPLGRSGSGPKDVTKEYTLMEFEFHERAEQKGKDGDKFAIARILVGTCNSMAAEDIDLMYYVFRNLLQFRALRASKGTFDDPGEVIGDACYRLSHDAIGFLRGNVVVEVHASAYEWRAGRIKPLGKPAPLLAKTVEAARRIDALLLEKMFTEETRTTIRAAERQRAEARKAEKAKDTNESEPQD